jgi:hypothetical protein
MEKKPTPKDRGRKATGLNGRKMRQPGCLMRGNSAFFVEGAWNDGQSAKNENDFLPDAVSHDFTLSAFLSC